MKDASQFMNDRADKQIKITDPKQGLEKAMAWCAYQERCQQETRDKLYSWGLWKDAVENIIAELITQNFLNEERFAKTYAGGKFRIKSWGKVKIRIELKRRSISDYCIRKAMLEIDEDDYLKTLRKVLSAYSAKIKEKHPLKKKYRLARYAQSRGFEQDLVWGILGEKE
jgi:regulatory protein